MAIWPSLRPATPADILAIVGLLEAAHLPPLELEPHLGHFVVAESDGRIVGCGGLETYPEASAGLVRSVAVDESLRGSGIGIAITEWLLLHADSLGLTRLFLFTMTARDFFIRFGFRDVTLEDFPSPVHESFQYRAAQRFGEQWGLTAMTRLPVDG